MTNAERFRSIFGIYATELWVMSEPEFLEWLNVENEPTQTNTSNTLNALDCVDTISRQAALDALAKNMPSLTTPDGTGQFDHDIQVTDEAYVDCMQIIHNLPSVSPRWIPVSERMPEKLGDYLITATGESLGKKYIRAEVGQWLGDAFWIGWYEPDKKILAWMPLPQPWKGENDG